MPADRKIFVLAYLKRAASDLEERAFFFASGTGWRGSELAVRNSYAQRTRRRSARCSTVGRARAAVLDATVLGLPARFLSVERRRSSFALAAGVRALRRTVRLRCLSAWRPTWLRNNFSNG